MPTLTIIFEGLCCFSEPQEGDPGGFARRAIFQDRSQHADDPHFCYIEFYKTDLDASENPGWELVPYYRRWDYIYQHVKIKNVRITLANDILSPPSLTILRSFDECIPKLSEVSPTFSRIQSRYLDRTVGSGVVGAYFDITAGVLSSGPAEEFRTKFEPEYAWPARHLGQWAQLELEIEGPPVLMVYDLAGKTAKPLILKPGTNLVTIGNQTEADVLGIPPSQDTKGHFEMYYDLAESVTVKPIPKSDELGLGTGCVPSSWR